MDKFVTPEQYADWINRQNWYQTMKLPSGVRTIGSVRTDHRIPQLAGLELAGKRVLDIGCNSGQYALYAKSAGAREVIGIDIDDERLKQARILSVNEGLKVRFERRDLFDLPELGQFDVVFCFAVLTEVTDFLGAVSAIKKVIGGRALFEIGLASNSWVPLNFRMWRSRSRVAELRQTKRGDWVMKPTVALLRELFGSDFAVQRLDGGLRYPLIDVQYRKSRV